MPMRLHCVVTSIPARFTPRTIPRRSRAPRTSLQTLPATGYLQLQNACSELRTRSISTTVRWRAQNENDDSIRPEQAQSNAIEPNEVSEAMTEPSKMPEDMVIEFEKPGTTTKCSGEEEGIHSVSESRSRHESDTSKPGRQKNKREHGRKYTQLQSKDILLKSPKGRPLSIPDAHLFQGLSTRQLRERFRGKTYEEIPAASWYANQAAPPLLLTFDAFDTLYTPKESIPKQYADVASQHGYMVSEDEIKGAFRNAFKAVSTDFPNQGKDAGLSPRKWWYKIIDATFTPFNKGGSGVPDSLMRALYRRFATSQGYKLFPDVLELLDTIGTGFSARDWAPKRTMLGIVSNSDPRVRSILDSFDIEITPSMFPPRAVPVHMNDDPEFGPAHFAFATLSYECGMEKPDQGIWTAALSTAQKALDAMAPVARLTRSSQHLLEDVNTDFHRCHVGDDLEKDVLSALKAGWDAVLLDRSAPELVSERVVTLPMPPSNSTDEQLESLKTRSITVINSLLAIPSIMTRERITSLLSPRLEREVEAAKARLFPIRREAKPNGAGQNPADIRAAESTEMLGPKLTPQGVKRKRRIRYMAAKKAMGF